ncbi:hypothetical protein PV326_010306, partial [Microctonus aethiopoides]
CDLEKVVDGIQTLCLILFSSFAHGVRWHNFPLESFPRVRFSLWPEEKKSSWESTQELDNNKRVRPVNIVGVPMLSANNSLLRIATINPRPRSMLFNITSDLLDGMKEYIWLLTLPIYKEDEREMSRFSFRRGLRRLWGVECHSGERSEKNRVHLGLFNV